MAGPCSYGTRSGAGSSASRGPYQMPQPGAWASPVRCRRSTRVFECGLGRHLRTPRADRGGGMATTGRCASAQRAVRRDLFQYFSPSVLQKSHAGRLAASVIAGDYAAGRPMTVLSAARAVAQRCSALSWIRVGSSLQCPRDRGRLRRLIPPRSRCSTLRFRCCGALWRARAWTQTPTRSADSSPGSAARRSMGRRPLSAMPPQRRQRRWLPGRRGRPVSTHRKQSTSMTRLPGLGVVVAAAASAGRVPGRSGSRRVRRRYVGTVGLLASSASSTACTESVSTASGLSPEADRRRTPQSSSAIRCSRSALRTWSPITRRWSRSKARATHS